MDPISLEDLALLDVLERIDQALAHGPNAAPLLERLVEVGLVEKSEGELVLTDAGIERCKSLHHRVAADSEAEQVVMGRQKAGEANPAKS